MKMIIGARAVLLARSLRVPVRAAARPCRGWRRVGSANVSFLTSCAPALRQDFNRAVALLHSFWFAQAIAAFDGVPQKIPRAPSRTGASRSAAGATRLRDCARRSRSSSAARQSRRRRRPARRRRASAHTSRRPPSSLPSAEPATQRARTLAYEQAHGAARQARIPATWRRASSTRSR